MEIDIPREGYCKESVYHAEGIMGHRSQCSRKAKAFGYCAQHHPDAKLARIVAQQARWAAERKARVGNRIQEEKNDRERILAPLIEALVSMRAEYSVSQPCRSPVDIVDGIIDLLREGLEVPTK